MILRQPRSTQSGSSAASDVYKRQLLQDPKIPLVPEKALISQSNVTSRSDRLDKLTAVSYTHLPAHETVLALVCRLLLEKKNGKITTNINKV